MHGKGGGCGAGRGIDARRENIARLLCRRLHGAVPNDRVGGEAGTGDRDLTVPAVRGFGATEVIESAGGGVVN